MTVTQRGKLSEEDERDLQEAVRAWRGSLETQAMVRAVVVESVSKSSYREVERLTGFSTNTLQRWKRGVGK